MAPFHLTSPTEHATCTIAALAESPACFHLVKAHPLDHNTFCLHRSLRTEPQPLSTSCTPGIMAVDNKEAPSPPRSRGKKKPSQKPAGPRVFPPVTVIVESRHRHTDRTKELRPLASPNSYQKSLIEVAEPGTPCQVELSEGDLAPDIARAAEDHPLRVTYNKLVSTLVSSQGVHTDHTVAIGPSSAHRV